jgi:hypothetical protein
MDDIKKILYKINYPYDNDLGVDDPNRFSTKLAAEQQLGDDTVLFKYRTIDVSTLSIKNVLSDEATDKYIILDNDNNILGLTLYIPFGETNPLVDSTDTGEDDVSSDKSKPGDTSTDTETKEAWKTDVNVVNTNVNDLHPILREKVKNVLIGMKAAGHDAKIMETYRTPARQLYVQSKAYSWTNWGYHNCVDSTGKPASQAVDIAVNASRIEDIYPPNADHPFWVELGKQYKQNGIEWGGDWEPPQTDLPHGQLKRGSTEEKSLYINSVQAKEAAIKLGKGPLTPGDFSSQYRMYVTWGFIEDYLLANADAPLNSLVYNSDKGEAESSQILNFPELRSCDLDVCILPGQEFIPNDYKIKANSEEYSVIKNSSRNYVDVLHAVYPFETVSNEEQDLSLIGPAAQTRYRFNDFSVNGNSKRGYLRNIAVNTSYIERVYNSLGNNPTLNQFITKLLAGINEACGNLWEFSMVSMPYSTDTLCVVDSNALHPDIINKINDTNENGLNFQIKRPFLKSFNMSSNLASALSSAAYVGTLGPSYSSILKDGTYFTLYGKNNNKIITDRFRKVAPADNTAKPSATQKVNKDDNNKIEIDDSNEEANPLLEYINDAYIYLNSGHKKDIAKSSLVNLVNKFKNNNDKLDFRPLSNLEVSITTPGFTGIYMGNSFTLESISQGGWLPDRYKESSLFQVNNVTHTINSKWETTISTILRHKSKILVKYIDDKDFYETYITDIKLDDNITSGKSWDVSNNASGTWGGKSKRDRLLKKAGRILEVSVAALQAVSTGPSTLITILGKKFF